MRVIKGRGMKNIEDIYESATLQVLIKDYAEKIGLQDTTDIFMILYSFQVYICSQYQQLYLENTTLKDTIDIYNSILKLRDGSVFFPSYILADLERIDALKKPEPKGVEVPSRTCGCLCFT